MHGYVTTKTTYNYEDLIEKVQRKATKLVPSISHLSYEERLQRLELPSLKYRRLRGDMIMTYKLLQGHYESGACAQFMKRNRRPSVTIASNIQSLFGANTSI